MAKKEAGHSEILNQIQKLVSPEVFAQVSSQLGAGITEASDNQNQNQNQGGMEELAKLKPDVLREITSGVKREEELSDNQNQNQGKLDELLKLKPSVLRQIRVGLRGGEEVMDNQNQNQGTQSGDFVEQVKPPVAE